jgi:hypothetical protein
VPVGLERPSAARYLQFERKKEERKATVSDATISRSETAGLRWGAALMSLAAWVGAIAAPVLALAVALPAHYPWGFATIGHLGLIYLATAIFVVGAVVSGKALLDARPLR